MLIPVNIQSQSGRRLSRFFAQAIDPDTDPDADPEKTAFAFRGRRDRGVLVADTKSEKGETPLGVGIGIEKIEDEGKSE